MKKGEVDVSDEAEIVLPDALPSGEASDELAQIRALLFGEHARKSLERIERVEAAVLEQLADLRAYIDTRIGEVEARLANEVDVRTSVATNLVTRLDEESQARRDGHAGLRRDLDEATERLQQQLGGARAELVERIERTNADLRERDIDLRRRSESIRSSLADVFGEAASILEDR